MATSPYEVGYPVNFYSGGDTTKEAFGKHIQEIQRIYGIINALNADKISAQEVTDRLNAHINSSNPHPNLDLSNTKGNLPTSRLSGNLDFSRITGNLDASRITGTLSNAYIDKSRVNGLENYIKGLIPKESIASESIYGNGFIKFSNGLMMQWGVTKSSEVGWNKAVTFPATFPNSCFLVVACLCGEASGYCSTTALSQTGFEFTVMYPDGKGVGWILNQDTGWIALGN